MQAPETRQSAPTPLRIEDIFAEVTDDLVEVERLIHDRIERDIG